MCMAGGRGRGEMLQMEGRGTATETASQTDKQDRANRQTRQGKQNKTRQTRQDRQTDRQSDSHSTRQTDRHSQSSAPPPPLWPRFPRHSPRADLVEAIDLVLQRNHLVATLGAGVSQLAFQLPNRLIPGRHVETKLVRRQRGSASMGGNRSITGEQWIGFDTIVERVIRTWSTTHPVSCPQPNPN